MLLRQQGALLLLRRRSLKERLLPNYAEVEVKTKDWETTTLVRTALLKNIGVTTTKKAIQETIDTKKTLITGGNFDAPTKAHLIAAVKASGSSSMGMGPIDVAIELPAPLIQPKDAGCMIQTPMRLL